MTISWPPPVTKPASRAATRFDDLRLEFDGECHRGRELPSGRCSAGRRGSVSRRTRSCPSGGRSLAQRRQAIRRVSLYPSRRDPRSRGGSSGYFFCRPRLTVGIARSSAVVCEPMDLLRLNNCRRPNRIAWFRSSDPARKRRARLQRKRGPVWTRATTRRNLEGIPGCLGRPAREPSAVCCRRRWRRAGAGCLRRFVELELVDVELVELELVKGGQLVDGGVRRRRRWDGRPRQGRKG